MAWNDGTLIKIQPESKQVLIRVLWALSAAVCCLFCANIALLLAVGSYDLHLGPLHFVAHQLFKPFLLTGAAFWIAVFLRGFIHQPSPTAASPKWLTHLTLLAIVLALYAAVYLTSAGINVSDQDWIRSDVSERLRSLPDALRLFTTPQPDGFYRPLPYLSLWADYRLLGSALWGYHLQSVLLHALNSMLVYKLAREFRFERNPALWAATWFSLAAMNFEPVLWPAARFDLLATAFVLVSVILFLRYLRDPGRATATLLFSGAAYGLALMSKEIAYCVPLLLAAIVFTRKSWLLDFLARPKLLRAAFVFAGITALMLAVRIAIYKSLGGYPATIHGGASPHFSFTFKSVTGLVSRVIPIPLLGLNTSLPLSPAMACFVVLFVAVIAWVVVRGAALAKPERVLVGLALLSALPALNLTGWVGESMQHSRYLYLPGLWIVIAAATVIARRPFGNIALALLITANLSGVVHNLGVYRTMLGKAHAISQQIARDCTQYHANIVDLASVDSEPFGVFFFRSEIAGTLRAARPDVCVSLVPGSCDPGKPALRYEWLQASADVHVHYLPEGVPNPER
jgi:hypothetical protein